MNDEESYSDSKSKPQLDDASVEGAIHQHGSDKDHTTIVYHDKPVLIEEEQLGQEITLTAKFLSIHQKRNHLPFKSIQLMAENGHYVKRLVDCCVPLCLACSFEKNIPVCLNTQVVTDDGESHSDSPSKPQADDASVEGTIHQHGSDDNANTIDFHDESVLIEEEPSEPEITSTAELLRLHQRLNHLPFRSIQLMAANGHYSKRLVDCCVRKCSACLFGKSTRRPWSNKAQPTDASKLCTFPGQCISVDQDRKSVV